MLASQQSAENTMDFCRVPLIVGVLVHYPCVILLGGLFITAALLLSMVLLRTGELSFSLLAVRLRGTSRMCH